MQLPLQFLPEDVLKQGNLQTAMTVFQERQGDTVTVAAFQSQPEIEAPPPGNRGQGQRIPPGADSGQLPLGPFRKVQDTDKAILIDCQEGSAAISIKQ